MATFALALMAGVIGFVIGWDFGLRDGMRATPSSRQPQESPQPVEDLSATIRIAEVPPADLSAEPDDGVLHVEHAVEPYWQEMGWQPRGKRLEGFYRTQVGSYQGYIDKWQSREPRFHIVSPPTELRQHSHWACFRPRGNGLFWVHFAHTPSGVDAGIVEIETVLSEALTRPH